MQTNLREINNGSSLKEVRDNLNYNFSEILQLFKDNGFVWRGEYQDYTNYQKSDVVKYNNSIYIAKNNTMTENPTNTSVWDLVLEGRQGEAWRTPSINIENGYWTVDGVSLGVFARWPQGERGEQWPQGLRGERGEQWPQWPQGIQWPVWPSGSGSGDMVKANNLSDVTNIGTARTNLDVYSKSEVDTKIQNATPNIDLSGYARKEHTHTIDQITDLQSSLDSKLDKSEKDAPNGIAILENGALPNRYLPPSDVLVHWEKSTFPAQGDTKKIYFEQSTRKIYVYNGSAWYKEYTAHIGRTKSLANGTDLNDILEDGWFVSETNVKSTTFRNTPIQRAFTLISYKAAGFIQEIIDYDLQSRWIRRYYGFLNNWSAWQEVPIAKQDISGKANLTGGNTFTGDQISNGGLYFKEYWDWANDSPDAHIGLPRNWGKGSIYIYLWKWDDNSGSFNVVNPKNDKILLSVAETSLVYASNWFVTTNKIFANRYIDYDSAKISLAIGDGNTGFHYFETGKFGIYANGTILQDFYVGHEPVCANGLGQYPTIKKMTKAQYGAIAVKENNVIYFITE